MDISRCPRLGLISPCSLYFESWNTRNACLEEFQTYLTYSSVCAMFHNCVLWIIKFAGNILKGNKKFKAHKRRFRHRENLISVLIRFQVSNNTDLISYATGFGLFATILRVLIFSHLITRKTVVLTAWTTSFGGVSNENSHSELIVPVNSDAAKIMDMHDTQRSLS